MATQVLSNWTLEILQPGQDSEVTTNCASVRLRNTSATTVLYIAPRGSSHRLPVPPGGVWGIDIPDVFDELATIISVFTEKHDAPVVVERIFKQLR